MKDAETSSILMSGLEGDNMRIAVKSTTAKALWDGLANKFQSKNVNNFIELQTSFYQVKQKPGQSIEDHLNHLEDLADKLAAIGEPVKDEQKLVFLFNSLLPDYAQYIISIKAIPNVTYSIASSMLRDVDRMLKKNLPEIPEEGSSALLVKKSNNKKGKSDYVKKCYYCKKEGHTASQCKSNPDANIKCNRCEKMGHRASNCRSKLPGKGSDNKGSRDRRDNGDSKKQGEDRDVRNSMIAVSEESAFTSQLTEEMGWAIDSGASQHMCRSKELFSELEDLQSPVFIRVGNGSKVEAKLSGKVQLNTRIKGGSDQITLSNVLYVPELAENLLSVRRATAKGFKFNFSGENVTILNPNQEIVGCGSVQKGLYRLELEGQGKMEEADLPSNEKALVSLGVDFFIRGLFKFLKMTY